MEYSGFKSFLNFLGAALVVAAAPCVLGDVNKCVGANGKVTYTEKPCSQNEARTTVKTSPSPQSDSSGLTANGALGQVQTTVKTSPAPQNESSGVGSNGALSSIDKSRCEFARKALEASKELQAQEVKFNNSAENLALFQKKSAELERLYSQMCTK